MVKNVPLVPTDFKRDVAKEPTVPMLNRFAENNPALSTEPVAVISRPGLKKFTEVGTGPVRKLYSQPGAFNGDLFAASGLKLYRINNLGISSDLGTISTSDVGSPSMAATAPIGDDVPAYLFIADGGVLWYYTENGSAIGHLEATGAIANNDTVVIDGIYYKFTNGGVDAGSPAGTAGNPWLVNFTGLNATDMDNLYNAINLTGVAGTDYSTVTTEHTSVSAVSVSGSDLYIAADVPGAAGNAIAVSETGANLAWENPTLEGGGADQLRQIIVPDDVGAISVAVINSYVIVIPVQEENIKGRFYWIEPGEITIDPLNFATAERSPDGLHQVVVFGDMFWLMGEKTTEPWVTTGDQTAPVQRFQGILFDRGSWEGTAVQVKDSLFIVDEDGGIFQINNGLKRVTQGRPDIEERVRKAIIAQSISF